MAGVRFTELQSRPMEFLDFTSVTLDEFQQLVPPFETAFQCHMAAWRMDGKPRTARRFTVYKTCLCSAIILSSLLWTITLAARIIIRDHYLAAKEHLRHDTMHGPAPPCVASHWHAADAAGRCRPFPSALLAPICGTGSGKPLSA